jgi:hypothetical protein
MGSENEIKRLSIFIWIQWFVIVLLVILAFVLVRDIRTINKSIDNIEKSIVAQQESCNGVSVRIDNVDQKLTEIKKLIEGEW